MVFDESENNPQLLDLLNIRYIATATDLTLGPNGKYSNFILGPGEDKIISLEGLYDHPVTYLHKDRGDHLPADRIDYSPRISWPTSEKRQKLK